MEEKYEIIDDEFDEGELDKEENLLGNLNHKNLETDSSKAYDSKRSKLSSKKESKEIGNQNSINKKLKSGTNSMMNKSIGITSLHNTTKKLEISIKRKSPSTSIPFGERLYRKALTIKELKEKKNNEELQKKELEIKRQCTFIPQLNETSCFKKIKKIYDRSVDTSFATAKPKKEIESFFKKKEDEELSQIRYLFLLII